MAYQIDDDYWRIRMLELATAQQALINQQIALMSEQATVNAGGNPRLATRDSFGRLRVSEPETLFDSKLSTANYALFWNFLQVSGTCTSTYSQARASNTIAVLANTAGHGVWQTKMRFNYQPGKSQQELATVVLPGLKAGITARAGIYDENNGLFFEVGASGLRVCRRTKTSGIVVDNYKDFAEFSFDPLDGSGDSLIDIDFTKSQIFAIDFESLQVGSVRFGMVVNGVLTYCHQMNHANILDVAYFSTPNLPIRYELINDGTGAAASLECICSTVISEGGSQETGITRYLSTTTHVDANASGTTYACVGIRLKAANLDSVVKIAKTSLINIAASTNDFEWKILLNPTVAGTFTYADEAFSALQVAYGATANTVTGGIALAGDFVQGNETASAVIQSLYYLGATIAGTPDTMVLCVRPLRANQDIHASLTVKEIA